jgi:peroxiredoxin
MRLQPGETAPDFSATDTEGRPISLAALRGRKVWLTFFRYAACPLCSYRVHELLAQWDQRFAPHDFTLVTVWQSQPAKLDEVKERYSPSFSLIADPDMELYRLYRVEKGIMKVFGKEVIDKISAARKAGISIVRAWEGPATRRPADFLIDSAGTIHTAFYGENVANMIPFEQVEEFLAA